ncbi:hypothetical protein ACEQ8H_008630 [Pleosporales sp. CAS-2024a]
MTFVSSNQNCDKADATQIERLESISKTNTVIDTYRSYSTEYRNENERKLVRKIDKRLLPLIVIIYLFNYLDRNSITQARLYGLQKDTHVNGAVYQTAISIFSAGYIAMQLPATMLMTKLRPSIFLPCCIIAWAIVSGCTSATSSPGGLLAVRFCLGLIEAPFFPGAIYLLSCWYTKRELGVRMALLVSGIVLSNAFAGLISAGILSGMSGVGHLAAWRWLFILEGVGTVVLGLVAMVFLPDYPATTKWLSETEKTVAQGRLAADSGSEDVLGEENISIWRGISQSVKDIGFKNNTKVLLLTSPPYLFAFVWSISFAAVADRKQTRSTAAGISALTAILGSIMLITVTDNPWARYAFTFLECSGTFGVYSTTYTWLSSTIPRPPVKRAAAIGISNTCANLASLFANYFWLDHYAPLFRVSWGCILAFECLVLSCIVTLRVVLKRGNKRLESLARETDPDDAAAMARLDDDSQRAVLNGFRYIT